MKKAIKCINDFVRSCGDAIPSWLRFYAYIMVGMFLTTVMFGQKQTTILFGIVVIISLWDLIIVIIRAHRKKKEHEEALQKLVDLSKNGGLIGAFQKFGEDFHKASEQILYGKKTEDDGNEH